MPDLILRDLAFSKSQKCARISLGFIKIHTCVNECVEVTQQFKFVSASLNMHMLEQICSADSVVFGWKFKPARSL